jgi:CBS-domain-containing membrane protein
MVGQDGVLEGIVSKSDLTGAISPYMRPAFAKWRKPLDDATLQIRIKWIMSKPVRTIRPETSLAAIMENMLQLGVLCLPVVDQQGKVQGLVAEANIFKALQV